VEGESGSLKGSGDRDVEGALYLFESLGQDVYVGEAEACHL
jgi:hypothetical protein